MEEYTFYVVTGLAVVVIVLICKTAILKLEIEELKKKIG